MNKEPVKHHYIPQFLLRNFCDQYLYSDDINNIDNPTKIEKDMTCFESGVAQFFFAIMAFRSKITSDNLGIKSIQ